MKNWNVIKKNSIFRSMMQRSSPESKHMADIFEETTAICEKPKKVSNWLMVETMRLLKEHEHGTRKISASHRIILQN